MNINRLKTFLTLAECLNFSEAAERLYCTQPTVSMQIKALEDELGCRLFDRIGKKIYLNQQGELLKSYANQMLNLWQEACSQVIALQSGEQGQLSFGSSHFIGIYLLPILLNRFRQRFPQISINLQIRSSMSLLSQLANNEVEFLILSDKIELNHELYFSKTFYHDELSLIVPAQHPLTRISNPTFADLQQYTFLWKPKHSATRSFLEQTFKNHGVRIDNYIEISNLEAIKQSIIHSLGIAFISKFAVKYELENNILTEIVLPNLNIIRGIDYVVRKDKILSPAAKQFIRLLEQLDSLADVYVESGI